MGIKVSIITAIYNSHEIVRRQQRYYNRLAYLMPEFEVIHIDDGSKPQIEYNDEYSPVNYQIIRTHNYKSWTEHIARNLGARIASGNYLLFIDIDYILTPGALSVSKRFNGDRMAFHRRFGVLDENGYLRNETTILKQYGLRNRWIRRGWVNGHRSQFLMRKDLFWRLGGYNEALDGTWRVTGGAGERFWRKWQRAEARGKVKTSPDTPTIYMFPVGKYCEPDFDESALFHDLHR